MTPTSTAPLQAIERIVQERAKALTLDRSRTEIDDVLRSLIQEEVSRWQDDVRRGRRNVELVDPDRLVERAFRNLARYGPITTLLEDPDVWEVMINSPSSIFVHRHRGPNGYHDEVFEDDDHVQRTLTKLLADSSSSHRKLDPAEGLQDAQLDDGARLYIVHGDLTRGGHLIVNIRKFTGLAFSGLDELVDAEMLSAAAARFLRAAVACHQSIVFAGAPGSGKTTLMNCCTAELDPTLRVVTAEEVFEADVPLPNVAALQTRGARPDRPAVELRQLVAAFLRMAPDIAIVGEVRDREALPLLLTLSSGVKGYTTIHAGSGRQALTRLRFVCQLSDVGSQLPMPALNTLVSEAVDLVVHLRRIDGAPRVTEILAVEDLAAGADAVQFTVTPLFARHPDSGLAWIGNLPARLAANFAQAGVDVRSTLPTVKGSPS